MVDYTIDGKPHRATAADREFILLADEEAKPPAATLDYDEEGRLWIEARANGSYETNTPLRLNDPGIAAVRKEVGPDAISIQESNTIGVEGLPEPIDVRGPWEVHFPTARAGRRRFRSTGSFRGASTRTQA